VRAARVDVLRVDLPLKVYRALASAHATEANHTAVTLLDDDLRAAEDCRLSTTGRRSGQPRQITIWFAAVGDVVFMLAGGREGAHWVRNIQADPVVRVQIKRRTFEGRGRSVEGESDDPAAREALAAKYGTKWLTRWLRESLPVRIDLEREIPG
jgi:deazaflavin-dependent oxidoreductase (nitroreductase family)